MTNIYREALNKLAKWRVVFASWQLGTRPLGDPECDAVRDHREATILLRAEVSAIQALLLEKKLVKEDDLNRATAEEAELISAAYERRFPGFKPTAYGMDIELAVARETMKGWRP